MSFSIVLSFNEVIVATLLIHIDTLSLPMSHFLRTLLRSLSTTLLALMSYLDPLFYPVPNTSPTPPATPPRPLHVYTRHPRTDTGPPANSSPMVPSSRKSVLPSPANLPIAIRKGIRSSHNCYPIYNFLTCHHLSSPYSAFVSTLSSVYVPQTVHEALSHRTRNRQWLRKLLLYILMALRT